jgi:UDP-glucose 4-epimerase
MASSSVINNAIELEAKVIFTSSMAVYGGQNPPFEERMLPAPTDPYGIAKYAVELDLANASDQFGLRYSIVRPHNVVGVFQNVWDRYRNVLGIFIRQALSGQDLTIYGDGSQVRAFSDISFYLEPLEKLIDSFDGETFNVGADKEITILELAQSVIGEAGKRGIHVDVQFLEARHEVQLAYCNHDKAKRVLSFEDRTDLEDLISTMFDWVAGEPRREVRKMEYEITKGLYSFWKN